MNSDIYERHRQAVETWREACQNVEFAERQRSEARAELDKASDDLLASCANSKPAKQGGKRGRRAKVNGVDPRIKFQLDAMMQAPGMKA